jgi:hypothetical protein
MCSHYQAIKARERYFRVFGVYPPAHEYVEDMWPKYMGAFIRRSPEADSGRADWSKGASPGHFVRTSRSAQCRQLRHVSGASRLPLPSAIRITWLVAADFSGVCFRWRIQPVDARH